MTTAPHAGRPAKPVRLDRDGVPIDPNDWTYEDWRDLWLGIRDIKAKVAERHRTEARPS